MKVLNITSWYPNKWNSTEALFIKEHFEACEPYVGQTIWHVQVRSEKSLFRGYFGEFSKKENYFILDTRIQQWRVLELLSLVLLILLRIRLGRRWWDIVNIHIAYPLLRFPRPFKWLFGKQVVITEHWSAYHRNFSLPDGSKAKQRMQRMFHHGIPVITVSRALMDDIIRFAGTDNFPQYIVPNVVDPDLFYPAKVHNREHEKPVFLMVASWAPIKRPLLVMAAFAEFLKTCPDAQLRIVGSGHQWANMKIFVAEHSLDENIELLGAMSKEAIAGEMRDADCFLHASDYETFSVVCAEALCCGLTVIASNVGGIPEFVNTSNGILVENTHQAWLNALTAFMEKQHTWDKHEISRIAVARFNPHEIGNRFLKVYEQVCNT
jgi:glycosyltransferase involved in cell wall biosynthesis